MGKYSIALFCLLAFASPIHSRQWKIGDPCPTDIHTTVPSYDDMPWHEDPSPTLVFGTMSNIHAALLSCPNITSLQLRVTGLGCSEWPDRWNFPFDLSGTDKYPPLQILHLDGYDFDQHAWGQVQPPQEVWYEDVIQTFEIWSSWIQNGNAWKYLKWCFLPEEQRSKRNLDLWLDAMDFSHIRTLALNTRSRDSFSNNVTKLLPPKLSSLNSLTVAGPTAHEFILGLPQNSLQNLTWLGYKNSSDLEPVLQHHGASLRHLTWYSDELNTYPRPMLSLEQLRRLISYAPELQSLVIDMGRDDDWPWEHLQIIAVEMPKLTDLTLYLDLASECRRQIADTSYSVMDRCRDECNGMEQYQQPLLNNTTAVDVAEFLRNHNAGGTLARVTLRSGDWSPSWDGPLYFPDWLEMKKAWMECVLGDEAGGGNGISCEGHNTRIENDRNRYCDDSKTNATHRAGGYLGSSVTEL